ncbi:MAG: signal peptidase I [Planctomycetia bacterium]|nr:signal peptidase I [Planctomycetia bacterium]
MSAKNNQKKTSSIPETQNSSDATVVTVAGNTAEQESTGRAVREIFESIAIALVLAFLFRTFLAEMFVIPTGSMAPTLFGQHKDVNCPECDARFQVGVMAGRTVECALCPNCNAVMNFKAETQKGNSNPNYTGDRILVGKYPYYFSSPKRWDVVVFLFPGGANMNYIKRCVGLPGETIKIQGGDIYVKPSKTEWERKMKLKERRLARKQNARGGADGVDDAQPTMQEAVQDERPFKIARKSPEKILATMIPVYENNYQSLRLRQLKDKVDETLKGKVPPSRWHQDNQINGQEYTGTQSYTEWVEQDDGKSFYCKSKPNEMTGWLVYQHLVFNQDAWERVKATEIPEVKPRLITDMTAYNSQARMVADMNLGEATSLREAEESCELRPEVPDRDYGVHWVKDLVMECQLDVRTLKTGEFQVGMNRGGKTFWCKVNLANGEVVLEIPARPDFGDDDVKQREYDENNLNKENAYIAKAQSGMNGTDKYHFRMANVDDQVHVWVDGKVLKFDMPTAYIADRELQIPTVEDMVRPVQIGCRNCEVKLSNLGLFRDIYYIARGRDNSLFSDFVEKMPDGVERTYYPDYDFFSNPARWEAFSNMRSVEFELEEEGERKYFMLGDNSANSADSRCWTYPDYDPRSNDYVTEHYVPESLLVGEAYFVYWPHTWYPFVPNVKDMRKIK